MGPGLRCLGLGCRSRGGTGPRGLGRCGDRRRGATGRRGGGRATDHVEATLEALDAGHDALGGVVGPRQQHTGAQELEEEPRCGGTTHLGEPLGHDVGGPAQLDRTEARGLGDQPLAGIHRDVDEPGRGRVGHRGHDHQVAQPTQQVLGEAPRVLPGLHHLVDDREDRAAVAGGEGLDHLVEQGVGREAQQVGGQLVGDAGRSGTAEQLVEDGERVACRPRPRSYDEGQRRRLDGDALLGGELGEVVAEETRGDQAERVVVGARADRRQHLVGLGRGEDEPQVGRGLLDQLEQGVEALRRDHVGLVDDVDLVAVAHGREERLLTQVARIVHTTVGRRVDLDDVDRSGPAARQLATAVALTARIGDRSLDAVERTGEDPGRGRLATAARAGEEVGVVDAVGRERSTQRLRDVILADDLGERLGPVAAIERER